MFRSTGLPIVKRERRLVRRDWVGLLSRGRRLKRYAHPLGAWRHSSQRLRSLLLTPSGFRNGANSTGRVASAPRPPTIFRSLVPGIAFRYCPALLPFV